MKIMEPTFIIVTSLQDWLMKEMKEIKITLHKRMKFSIKDLFSKCDQIHRELRIWSHLLKKSLKKNFIFCFYNQNILCVRKIETHLTFTASCESFSIKDKTPSSITTNESENFFPACAKIHF